MNKIKRYIVKICLIFIIFCSFVLMAFAVGNREVLMETMFRTGEVKIELNSSTPIFDDYINVEPNGTVCEYVQVKNVGTADCYYHIYLQNVGGELADKIVFDVYDMDKKLLKTVTPQKFTKENSLDLKEILLVGHSDEFSIEAHFTEENGNKYQSTKVTFDIVAEAIQSKNYKVD